MNRYLCKSSRLVLLSIALFAFIGCAPSETPSAGTSDLTPAKYSLPDSGYEVVAPEGFKVKQGVFYHEPLHTTFHFAHEDGADYEKVAAEFTEENVNQGAKKLLGKESVDVDGTKGLLIEILREAKGKEQVMWTVVYPDRTGVSQIAVIIRKDQPKAVQDAMKAALLTVKRIEKK